MSCLSCCLICITRFEDASLIFSSVSRRFFSNREMAWKVSLNSTTFSSHIFMRDLRGSRCFKAASEKCSTSWSLCVLKAHRTQTHVWHGSQKNLNVTKYNNYVIYVLDLIYHKYSIENCKMIFNLFAKNDQLLLIIRNEFMKTR